MPLEDDTESLISDVVYQSRRPDDLESLVSDLTDDVSDMASVKDFHDLGGDDDELDDQDDDIFGETNELEWPETACRYCGIHSPACVVKCVTCNKWFCNAKGNMSSSHIVNHLVRSRHKQVALHPQSTLGDDVLECYNCGCKNVFVLGFITAKQETVVVILCRQPCAKFSSSKSVTWDTAEWQPLIEDRSFLTWLAATPSERQELASRLLSPHQISQLEAAWVQNPDARLADVELPVDQTEDLQPVQLRYEDGYEYQRCFGPLVKAVAEHDKKVKESFTQTDISVTWDVGLSNCLLASFALPDMDTPDFKLTMGEELQLQHPEFPKWVARGFIVKIPNHLSHQFTIELDHKSKNVTGLTEGFVLSIVWSDITYKRVQRALKTLATTETSVSSYIYHKLLGHEVDPLEFSFKVPIPTDFTAPSVPSLNESQVEAVKIAISRPLTLIQGPPGTGKTMVSTSLVYHLVKLTKSPVLVCAPSNVAVDQLAQRLSKTGLNVVRVAARSREHLDSSVSELSLHQRVKELAKSGKEGSALNSLHKLMLLQEELGELSKEDMYQYKKHFRKAENKLLMAADVVCTTCVGSADRRIATKAFRTALIDETTQATEPECLIPITHSCKQVILVGDHQQLGPVITNVQAAQAGLRQSLFERLIILGNIPVRLTVQYRMHPGLSEFSSNMFYEGSLQNGITRQQRLRPEIVFPWPQEETPMMFWVTSGQEEISASSTSYLNRFEAYNVEKVVTKFFKSGVSPSQIGIITPYEGQRTYLTQYMTQSGTLNKDLYKEIEVESVDAFQGREKDYIILSCVRSNEQSGIGFLSDPRRLNVALTRAKYGMVITGNPRVLSRNPLWSHLLFHFREHGCLVEGSLQNLRKSNVHLSRPKQKFAYRQIDPKHIRQERGDQAETNSMFSFNGGLAGADELDDGTGAFGGFGINVNQWLGDVSTPRPNENQTRAIGASMSERMTKMLEEQQLEDGYIDDDLESISSSFAGKVGLY